MRWLRASQLPNGKWGRFLEIGTNKALYYDRGRIRLDSLHQLSLERRTGYGYETDISNSLEDVELRFQLVSNNASSCQKINKENRLSELADQVQDIIKSQDRQGRWIVRQDKFRKEISVQKWNGEYRIEDRISSALFNRYVAVLSEFLELYNEL